MSIIRTGAPLVLAAALGILAPGAGAQQPGFEGRIALRLQDTAPQGANYSIRGKQVAIDAPSVAHAHDLHAVYDLGRGPGLGGSSPEVAIEKTARRRAVVGQACEEWTLTADSRTVRACVVPGVPWVDPRRVVGGEVPAWSRRLEQERAFPVSVTEGDNASWSTDVARGPVPDSVFVTRRAAHRP